MKGDFSRDTFDPTRHFSRVLMQQGRVQLDADWNEQASILLHYLRRLTADVLGPGRAVSYKEGADTKFGFWIDPEDTAGRLTDLRIGQGRLYAHGILCENDGDGVGFSSQGDYPLTDEEVEDALDSLPLVVFLDVWERHITHIQDSRIREVALGGPDTATRTKVVWQVKTLPEAEETWNEFEKRQEETTRGSLKAGTRDLEGSDKDDPCLSAPDAGYRGPENQLYRVEIHSDSDYADGATFKWSRENGSVVFPIASLSGSVATLEDLGKDERLGLAVDDWVEVIDDKKVLRGEPGWLARVTSIDAVERRIELDGNGWPNYDQRSDDPSLGHPILRRWDYRHEAQGGGEKATDGALKVVEDEWIRLEDGVQVQFESGSPGHEYRTGDYWLIPARTATGDVEWPREGEERLPVALPPHGVVHHYLRLGKIDSPSAFQKNEDVYREP